jgi:hypothetical protein
MWNQNIEGAHAFKIPKNNLFFLKYLPHSVNM